jgi:hypothetical protein
MVIGQNGQNGVDVQTQQIPQIMIGIQNVVESVKILNQSTEETLVLLLSQHLQVLVTQSKMISSPAMLQVDKSI